ncbi:MULTISPECIES: hypothetical protein [unclassified Streptomyces]|uniref:hypothetical protein n=1 Tax=unclassified Streptomyces TaxID=2593676 RepID=UPI0006FF8E03|nr:MULTISPECIES: hypothetical protein [unclassified Streptomyces]KQX53047.1 hypothetical protein ASD33_07410 [Streptomyces sp. Root1304]KRA89968.1 hypothetical protein ASE09_07420 [Streptomyces sp. Root66D1]
MIIDDALGDAVRNNAEWCQAMCHAHGHPGTFGVRAWTNDRRTPLYYPEAVTLTGDATVEDVLTGIDRTTPYASVKDSYARLDLAAEGFRVIVEAQWIHRAAGLPLPAATGDWRPVRTPEELAAWALAWSDGDAGDATLFRPELLADPATTVVAGYTSHGRILGGAVLTASARVTGVSNLFTTEGTDPSAAWAGVLGAAPTDRPVVGYESGEDLPPALATGFEEIGPLRVWLDA